MSTLIAKNYIETGFSINDAQKLYAAIQKELGKESISSEILTIDFEGVKFYTTQFFNNSISKYVLELGPGKFDKQFLVVNLSEAGEVTYKHSIDNAASYYDLPPEKRLEQDEIIGKNEELE